MYIKYIYILTQQVCKFLTVFFDWVRAPEGALFYTPETRANPTQEKFNLFPQGHPLSKHIYNMYIYIYIDSICVCALFWGPNG